MRECQSMSPSRSPVSSHFPTTTAVIICGHHLPTSNGPGRIDADNEKEAMRSDGGGEGRGEEESRRGRKQNKIKIRRTKRKKEEVSLQLHR